MTRFRLDTSDNPGNPHARVEELDSPVSCAYDKCRRPFVDGSSVLKAGEGRYFCSDDCATMSEMWVNGFNVQIKYTAPASDSSPPEAGSPP